MRRSRESKAGRRQSTPPPVRPCEWPGCDGAGEHRAPRSRERLDEYVWYCLDHVRQFNASWNYYSGMSEDEVEADRRRDVCWQRPSWPLSPEAKRAAAQAAAEGFHDPFGLFEGGPGCGPDADHRASQRWPDGTPEAQALAVLDLRPPLSLDTLKARYKKLVKRHHPDANNGDKAAEERFKQITQAYQTLLVRLAADEKRVYT